MLISIDSESLVVLPYKRILEILSSPKQRDIRTRFIQLSANQSLTFTSIDAAAVRTFQLIFACTEPLLLLKPASADKQKG